jgi:hypothetical protein
MLALITALFVMFPMLCVAQQLHAKPLSKPKQPSVENRKANPQTENTANNQPVESPKTTSNGCSKEAPAGTGKGKHDQGRPPDGLYVGYLVATIASVVVAFISLGFVYWQIRIASRVADAALASAAASEKSANLAEVSVNALRDVESATVLMVGIDKPSFSPFGGGSSTDRVDVQSRCTFKNCGRTPAVVLALNYELQLGESIDRPPNVSIYDIGRSKLQPFVAAPNEPLSMPVKVEPEGTISTFERDAVLYTSNRCLWFCGIIRFRDRFERTWITKFCHLWDITLSKSEDVWRAAGPAEYNVCRKETD